MSCFEVIFLESVQNRFTIFIYDISDIIDKRQLSEIIRVYFQNNTEISPINIFSRFFLNEQKKGTSLL